MYDVGFMGNGALCGLAAITAGCSTVNPWAAIIIGGVAGTGYVVSSKVMVLLHMDDPLDAISVHAFGGTWGVFAVGKDPLAPPPSVSPPRCRHRRALHWLVCSPLPAGSGQRGSHMWQTSIAPCCTCIGERSLCLHARPKSGGLEALLTALSIHASTRIAMLRCVLADLAEPADTLSQAVLMDAIGVAGFFAKANLMSVAYPAVSPMDAGVFFGGTGRLLAAQLIHIIWIAGELPP